MKITVTTSGSLIDASGRSRQFAHTLSANIRRRLQVDLDRELEEILQSERAVSSEISDPEARRDALERAVRRIWGASQ